MENHGKSPFCIGKPSISMGHIWAIYTMAMLNNQRDPEGMSFYSPGLSTCRMCFLIFTAIGVHSSLHQEELKPTKLGDAL